MNLLDIQSKQWWQEALDVSQLNSFVVLQSLCADMLS